MMATAMLKMVGPDLGGRPLTLVMESFLIRPTMEAVADALEDAWAKGLSLPSRTTPSHFTEILGGTVGSPDRRISRSESVLCRFEPVPRGGMYRTSILLGSTQDQGLLLFDAAIGHGGQRRVLVELGPSSKRVARGHPCT